MKKSVSILLGLFICFLLPAQNISDLIISEAMPSCSESLTDGYGRHSAWIEIFNTSQGTVNFAGCYITDDLSEPTKCQIPKGYSATRLGPRQLAIFHASEDNARGVFYINFDILPGSSVYLISNDGRSVIDSLTLPEDLPEGLSASKFSNDAKELVFDELRAAVPTPGLVNGRHEQKSRAQSVKETDPHGFILSVVAVLVVFTALLLLFVIYNISGNIFSGKYKSASSCDDETALAIALALHAERQCGDDIAAAIAMALHCHIEGGVHDAEPLFISIVGNPSSPWNNKAFTLRKKVRQI